MQHAKPGALEALAPNPPGCDLGADPTAPANAVRIHGTELILDALVDPSIRDPEWQAMQRARLHAAQPFPHLVIENLFNPTLLRLVEQEFDDFSGWTSHSNRYENTRRSPLGAALGPAAQLYFDTINSGWFTQHLSAITGVPYLLSDPLLFGGGLHESRKGSRFEIHRDFARHRHVGLKNEMVFITYLNENWDPEWGGALELWNASRTRCITQVLPEFGRTLLMPHGLATYHGHPHPLATPAEVARRSVAAYYYTSPQAGRTREDEMSSDFIRVRPLDRIKSAARLITPPVLWSAMRKIRRS